MRAVRYSEYGGPDELDVVDVDRPRPGDDELLVEVAYAGVNPVDVKVQSGSYSQKRGGDHLALPKTPGSDFAGVVAAVGDDVDAFAAGDRVFGTGLHRDRRFGSYAEYVATPIDRVARLPDEVSFETGAAVALVGVTAWRAAIDHGGIAPGETCLVHGASGGVGHVAVQLAAIAGGEVLGTVGSGPAEDAVTDLGADAVLRYDRPDLRDAVLDLAPDGADVVLDHRTGDYLGFDVEVAARLGRIVVYSGDDGTPDGPLARRKELSVQFMGMSNLVTDSQLPAIADVLEKLAPLLARGELRVEIAGTYPLAEAAAAHRAVGEDSFVGKLLVEP